jgi:hypothetical protein
MNLEESSNILARTIDRQLTKSDPRDLSPYVVGRLLSEIDDLLKELTQSYKDNSLDSSSDADSSQVTFLNSLLKELGDNFFPMAHTDKPLKDLRIVTVNDLTELLQVSEQLNNIFECCRSYIVNVDEIIRVSETAMTLDVALRRQSLERELTSIDKMLLLLRSFQQQIDKVLKR